MTTACSTPVLNKFIAVALLCFGLAACQQGSSDPMQQPIAATAEEQLLESLLRIKQTVPEADYQRLLQAVATLRTYDLEALSVEQHLATLDGKSALEIIAAADQLSRRQQAGISQ